jgi:RNA polymerase sigma-70 factor (ECF subfamily)
VTEDPFVTHRSLLFTVACEMLGSAADAEDVVQETWLRWARDTRVGRGVLRHVVLVADGGGEVAAVRRPIAGSARVASLLARFSTIAPGAVIAAVSLNGAPAARVELNTAASLIVADGRITHIYAIRNPRKLALLDEEAALSR